MRLDTGKQIGFSEVKDRAVQERERARDLGMQDNLLYFRSLCTRPAATCELSSADLVGPVDLPSDEIQIQDPDSRIPGFQVPVPMLPRLVGQGADHGADDRCICTDHRAHVAVAASNFLEAASGQGSASSTSTSFVTCPCPSCFARRCRVSLLLALPSHPMPCSPGTTRSNDDCRND